MDHGFGFVNSQHGCWLPCEMTDLGEIVSDLAVMFSKSVRSGRRFDQRLINR